MVTPERVASGLTGLNNTQSGVLVALHLAVPPLLSDFAGSRVAERRLALTLRRRMSFRDRDDRDEESSAERLQATAKSLLPSGKKVKIGIFGFVLFILLWASFKIVDAGYAGVRITLGKVNSYAWEPGIHFKLPFVTSVEMISTRLDKHPVTAPAASNDLQAVTAEVTVPFFINAATTPGVYSQLGNLDNIKVTIIDPGVQESVKAVTAKYTAEQLVTQREKVKGEIESTIKQYVVDALAAKNLPKEAIVIGNVAITHFDFSPEFNKSIELKVTALQDALRAANEKQQKVTTAEGDRDAQERRADGKAYQIEVESKAEAAAIQRKAEALRANPNLIQWEGVNKWNGGLPQFMGGQAPIPFFNVGGKQ